MNKQEMVASVARVLARNKVKKLVHTDKRVLKITDITYKEETNSGQISIKPRDKMVKYTADDVSNILDGIIAVLTDAISHGESVSISGIGKFSVQRKAPRKMRRPDNGELIEIPERYVVKVLPSLALREAASHYGLAKANNPQGFIMPDPIYDQFETPDEDEDEEVDMDVTNTEA